MLEKIGYTLVIVGALVVLISTLILTFSESFYIGLIMLGIFSMLIGGTIIEIHK